MTRKIHWPPHVHTPPPQTKQGEITCTVNPCCRPRHNSGEPQGRACFSLVLFTFPPPCFLRQSVAVVKLTTEQSSLASKRGCGSRLCLLSHWDSRNLLSPLGLSHSFPSGAAGKLVTFYLDRLLVERDLMFGHCTEILGCAHRSEVLR